MLGRIRDGRMKGLAYERKMPPERVEAYLAHLHPDHAARVRGRLERDGVRISDGVLPSRLFAGEDSRRIPDGVMRELRMQADAASASTSSRDEAIGRQVATELTAEEYEESRSHQLAALAAGEVARPDANDRRPVDATR
jgi:hypothetical protein